MIGLWPFLSQSACWHNPADIAHLSSHQLCPTVNLRFLSLSTPKYCIHIKLIHGTFRPIYSTRKKEKKQRCLNAAAAITPLPPAQVVFFCFCLQAVAAHMPLYFFFFSFCLVSYGLTIRLTCNIDRHFNTMSAVHTMLMLLIQSYPSKCPLKKSHEPRN